MAGADDSCEKLALAAVDATDCAIEGTVSEASREEGLPGRWVIAGGTAAGGGAATRGLASGLATSALTLAGFAAGLATVLALAGLGAGLAAALAGGLATGFATDFRSLATSRALAGGALAATVFAAETLGAGLLDLPLLLTGCGALAVLTFTSCLLAGLYCAFLAPCELRTAAMRRMCRPRAWQFGNSLTHGCRGSSAGECTG